MAFRVAEEPDQLGGADVLLPVDVVAADSFSADADTQVVAADALADGWLGLDIGPETRAEFAAAIREARTIFWNGPMGVFEWPRFAAGTFAGAPARAPFARVTPAGGGASVRP